MFWRKSKKKTTNKPKERKDYNDPSIEFVATGPDFDPEEIGFNMEEFRKKYHVLYEGEFKDL